MQSETVLWIASSDLASVERRDQEERKVVGQRAPSAERKREQMAGGVYLSNSSVAL